MEKWRKIWYSFKYGNKKTRSYIISMVVIFAMAAVTLALAIKKSSPLWAMITIFLILLNIIVMQSVSFKDSGKLVKRNIQAKTGKHKSKQEAVKKENDKNSSLTKTKSRLENDEEHIKSEPDDRQQRDDAGTETEKSVFDELTDKELKSVMVKYKVKKEYVPVMIDSGRSKDIRETPAFMWKAGNTVNFLLFGDEIRTISIPFNGSAIIYEPGIMAHPSREYTEFGKPSFLATVFTPYLPTYYTENFAGRSFTKKNLYVMAPDIMLTNTSAKNALKILKTDVKLGDAVSKNEQHSQYYCDAYKLSIFWKDGIIDTKAYKERVKKLLGDMIKTEMTYNDYQGYVEEMIRGSLITKEYAEYFLGLMADKRLKNTNKNRL